MVNTDEGRWKHTPITDEETKGHVSTANTDEGGQKNHQLETRKTWVSMANTDEGGWVQMREDGSTHQLQTRRQKGHVSMANTDGGG